jgi:steroid delta-isomerase-like uncharacterized protein
MPGQGEMLATVRLFTDCLQRGDFHGAARLCTPDVVRTAPDGTRQSGRDEVAAYWQTLFTAVPDSRMEVLRTHVPDQQTVAIEYQFTGTHLGPLALRPGATPVPATGRTVRAQFCSIFTCNDACEITSYLTIGDSVSMQAQLGLAPSSPVTPSDCLGTVEKLDASLNRHDAEAFAACYAETAVRKINGLVELRGRAAIRASVEQLLRAYPDLSATVTSRQVEGNTVISQWTIRGTNSGAQPGMPATNRTVALPCVSIAEVGLAGVINERLYFDNAVVLRQLGLMPGS